MKKTIIIIALLLIACSANAQKLTEVWTPVHTWSNLKEITPTHILFDVNTETFGVTQTPWGVSWKVTQWWTRPMYFYVFAQSADNINQFAKVCAVKGPSEGRNRCYLQGRCYLNIASIYAKWEVTIYKITYK